MKIMRTKLTRPPTLTSKRRRARLTRSTSQPRAQITSRSWRVLGPAREIKSSSRQRLNSNAPPELPSDRVCLVQESPRAFSRITTHRTRSTAAKSRADWTPSSASPTFMSAQKLETRSGHKTPNILSQGRSSSLKLQQNCRNNEKPSQ